MISLEQANAFDRDGFLLVESLFSQEEVNVLLSQIDAGGRVAKHKFDRADAAGRSSKLALWTDIRDDVFGLVSASPRIVSTARLLLREDVYHWHSKVMLKEARVGGAWEWHQDYGYWYGNGCLYPRMISCMLALDPANKENGCLKVLVGSHLLGRVDHGKTGEQAGAEPERMAAIEQRFPLRYCEAGPGSVLFFHANLFHSSEVNLSDRPRRAYICCYNALANVPYGGKGHGKVEPIRLAPDDAVLEFGKAAVLAR
jgi:ectoine hydroxylase-related dioxygenase (phytanoyl-CoA dioxygenase family)